MSLGRKGVLALALAVSALALVGAAGCGEEKESEVVEGEPLELGELAINVQLTRFLNVSDREDSEYVTGQQVPPPPDTDYLAVFMEIDNESDHEQLLPSQLEMKIEDTTGETYTPLESASVFALPLGGPIPAHERIPLEDTAAAEGRTQGSIVLFLVASGIGENRPLELEITSGGEEGKVELDI